MYPNQSLIRFLRDNDVVSDLISVGVTSISLAGKVGLIPVQIFPSNLSCNSSSSPPTITARTPSAL